jgi:hypothetical protein
MLNSLRAGVKRLRSRAQRSLGRAAAPTTIRKRGLHLARRSPGQPAAVRSIAVAGIVVAGLGAGGAVVALGSDRDGARPRAAAADTRSCAPTVDATLRAVAMRIYAEAATGPNAVSATRRLERSPALARAVRRGDAARTRAALRPLLRGQIHRIVITHGARVMARVGTAPALAPVSGALLDASGRPVGRYTLAVGEQAPIVGIIQALTGARVQVLPGSAPAPAGATASFPATAFPSGTRRVWLGGGTRVACAAAPAQTIDRTIGAIAARLYDVEARGPATRRVLRHVATDPRFVAAVAHDDRVALRATIVRFFRTHSLHVVRIRATTAAGRLVGDVGGPFVLAPATTTVIEHGRVIGHVTLSVQDDTGYMKLVRRFTGAAVLMRTATGVVPGSAAATVAPAYTFTATAFPQGDLGIALFG